MSEKNIKVTKVVDGKGISETFEVPESYYNRFLLSDKRYSVVGSAKAQPKVEEKPKTEEKEQKSEAKAGK